MSYTNQRKQEPNTRQTSRAPETRLVLLNLRVPLVDINRLRDSRRDSQRHSRTDLERRIDHPTAETLHVHRDSGQHRRGGGDVRDRDASHADQGGREDVCPARWSALCFEGASRVRGERTYKFILSAVRQLGTGASIDRPIPSSKRILPLTFSTARPQISDVMNPPAPIGKNRIAVSLADSWSTSCAMSTR